MILKGIDSVIFFKKVTGGLYGPENKGSNDGDESACLMPVDDAY
jgi:hypothetical protein